MSDKCICHFCGYEIKDAEARSKIAALNVNIETLNTQGKQLATAVSESALSLQRYTDKKCDDIKAASKVAVTGNYELNPNNDLSAGSFLTRNLVLECLRYNINAGMVFVALKFEFTGVMDPSDVYVFTFDGLAPTPNEYMPFYPMSVLSPAPITADGEQMFQAWVNSNGVNIQANKAVEAMETATVVWLSGWYPYDEEE